MKKLYKLIMAIIIALSGNYASAQYCLPSYSYGCNYTDGLSLFQLGTISQTIGCNGSPNTWYHDYTASATPLQIGVPATITVQTGYADTYATVFIDYNNNNTFDATEAIANINCSVANTNFTLTFTPPAGTTVGNHRLRFCTEWQTFLTNACSANSYGNCADFTVTLLNMPGAAVSITGSSSVCQETNNVNYSIPPVSSATGYNWTLLAGANIVAGANTNSILVHYSSVATSGTISVAGTNFLGTGTASSLTVTVKPTQIPYLSSTFTTINLYTESFENGGNLPAGWAIDTLNGANNITFVTSSSFPSGFLPTDGNYCVRFNSFDVDGGIMRLKQTTPFSTLGSTDVFISVDWLESNAFVGYEDKADIEWSTDGSTWTSFTTLNRYNAIQGWKNKNITLPAEALGQATLFIAFKFTSLYGNDCYLDNLKIAKHNYTVCDGTSIPYTTDASMSGYTWNAAPGGTVTSGAGTNAVNVLWNNAGIQPLSITYMNSNGCQGNKIVNVTVNPKPIPTIIGATISCSGSSTVRYDTESGMTGYNWAVSAGGIITDGEGTNSIDVTWNTAGTQNVSVNYTNASGCTASSPYSIMVLVNASPAPTIAATFNDLMVTESFENGGNMPAGWATETLTPGNTIFVTSTTIWPLNGYPVYDGSYMLRFDSYDYDGGVVRLKKTIPVSTLGLTNVAVDFAWFESTEYSTFSDGVDIEWSTNGTNWNTAGTFSRFNAVQGWKLKSQSLPVGASNQASLYIAFKFFSHFGEDCYLDLVKISAHPYPLCMGTTFSYSTEAGMTDYLWTTSQGNIITSGAGTNTVNVQWNSPGAQTLSVAYTNGAGCSNITPTTSNVTVIPLPVPAITGLNDICLASPNATYATEPGKTNYNWIVSAGGSITAGSGTNSINVTWNNAGAQTVKVNYTDPSGCNASSPTTTNVNVNAIPPTPVITQSLDTLYSSVATGNQWYSQATGIITVATNRWYVPTVNGVYYDIVTINSCVSATSSMFAYLTVSVNDISAQQTIKVYPNPANDLIYIEQDESREATIRLLDISGKMVYNGVIVDAKNKIDITNLPAEIYTLHYNSGETSTVVKIVKMK